MRIHETVATAFGAEVICDRCGAKARHDKDFGLSEW